MSKDSNIIEDQEFNNNYEIMQEIGKGAFAQVYLARKKNTEEDEEIAVKVMDKEKSQEESFQNELKIHRQFESPYVINIHSYFETPSSFVILMEYANAGELFNYIDDDHSYSESDAAFYTQQILFALKVLHDNKIIHRDLKPANLLLSINYDTYEKTVKISDFGLARKVTSDDEKIDSEFCGTHKYSAPEIIDNKPYDKSVDIWSLGVIVYILLCGEYPFDCDDRLLDEKITTADYNTESYEWEILSEEAKDFVAKLLQMEPEKRMTIDEALKHQWLSGNAPKVQLGEMKKHLKKFNLQEKLRRVANRTKTALKFRKLLSKE